MDSTTKQLISMHKHRPMMISAIPAVTVGPVARPVSAKRVTRLRLNWFVIGSVFGVGMSFFMNLMITTVIVPEYDAVMAHHGDVTIAEADKPAQIATPVAPAPVVTAALGPMSPAGLSSLPAGPVMSTAVSAAQTISTAAAYPRTLAVQLGRGETLLAMLIRQQVEPKEAARVVDALDDKINPKSLKAGQKISITLARNETLGDKASVKELAIRLPNLSAIELQALQQGGYNVASTTEPLTQQPYRAYGKVRTSFSQAAAEAGIPMPMMNELIAAYSYDVDFQRDIHPGDTIEVLIDRKVSKDGLVGGYGGVRYASLMLGKKKVEIYKFKDGSGEMAWYDEKGNAVKKSLLRTPLDGARITSGFGMREHPLLGYTKFHKGVDFGAPQGTPIMAAGNAVVEQAGWVNGYGNFVLLKHNDTYETAYAHCSRFAVHAGQRVKQGDVIAYVGMTGMATGPHLHYEVRVHGDQVNPVAKQFNMASGLTGKALTAFKMNKGSVARELTALANPKAAKPVDAAKAAAPAAKPDQTAAATQASAQQAAAKFAQQIASR